MPPYKVLVVLINYNGSQFLEEACLTMLDEFYNANLSLNYFIWDNASNDDSQDIIKKLVKENDCVSAYFSDENLGFGEAVNRVVKLHSCDYIILQNNDTKIISLVDSLRLIESGAFPNNTIMTTNILNEDMTKQKNIFSYPSLIKLFLELFLLKGLFLRLKGYFFSREGEYKYDSLRGRYFSGCFWVLSRETFGKGFDASFKFYHEECMFFMRLEQCGVKKRIIDTDQVVHYGGGSGVSEFTFVNYYLGLLKLFKYKGVFSYSLARVLLISGCLYRMIFIALGFSVSTNPLAPVYKKGQKLKLSRLKVFNYHISLLKGLWWLND